MNKFSLYDVVKLVDSKSDTSVPINSIGTIVDINDNYPNSYMGALMAKMMTGNLMDCRLLKRNLADRNCK